MSEDAHGTAFEADHQPAAPTCHRHSEVAPQPAAPEVEKLYHELLYAVIRKFPGESRHETALRYIMEAENRGSQGSVGSRATRRTDRQSWLGQERAT